MNKKPIEHLGVTVLPEYIQSEGADAVLNNLAGRLSATAVTTSPYVAIESSEGIGSREPPIDGGAGSVRLLDRPLWSKKEVWMQTAPSFTPNPKNYEGSPYQPDPATDLTDSQGAVISDFVASAKDRGVETYLQVMAAIPPCYRVQFGRPLDVDQPLMPNGQQVPPRVDQTVTLASSGLRAYMRGLIADLCESYPDVSGFRFDWPEYPPYHFMSLLADYNPQVAPFAAQIGIDFDKLKSEMNAACPFPAVRAGVLDDLPIAELLNNVSASSEAFSDHFRLRQHLVTSYARFLREQVDRSSKGTKKILLQGFPPPWNLLSGFDAAALRPFADELAIKFYTMHWPMMGDNYAKHAGALLDLPKSTSQAYFRKHVMQVPADTTTNGDLTYPSPDAAHGIPSQTIQNKIDAFGDTDVIGISHGYGPDQDVTERFSAVLMATKGKAELNRYCYLSDSKIAALQNAVEGFKKSVP